MPIKAMKLRSWSPHRRHHTFLSLAAFLEVFPRFLRAGRLRRFLRSVEFALLCD